MHIHSLRRAALTACAFAALAAPSAADAVTTQLRVEADGKDIGPGFHYVHDSVTYETSTDCGGSGDSYTIDGPSALGLLVQAAEFTSELRPVQISDEFEFGKFVCGVGGYEGGDAGYWSYKVDHVLAEVGGDQFPIDGSHGGVLWYFVNTATGSNTGKELELVLAQNIVEAGKSVNVTVREYDDAGEASRAGGVRLVGPGIRDVTTDAEGHATLTFDAAGQPFVRGVREGDIQTDLLHLCVWEQTASECNNWQTGWVVGTGEGDRMRGTANPERIAGRAGDDRINSRGDSRADIVRCGRGDDVALVDRLDRVKRSCETVRRR